MRNETIKKSLLIMIVTVLILLPFAVQASEKGDVEKKPEVKCQLEFSLEGWSAFYQRADGRGVIACSNGQREDVDISARGGGITFGKKKITDGHGTFSAVNDISELFGSYASSGAHAGAVDSAEARAMTKGDVSLALSGTGKGFDLGFDFGRFKITPKKAKPS